MRVMSTLATAVAARCKAKPADYSLGVTGDAAIDKIRVESPTRVELWAGLLVWGFEATAGRWKLHDLTKL